MVTCKLHIVAVFFFHLGAVLANTPPFVTFGPASGSVFKQESIPIGTKLFTITARDSDSSQLSFFTNNTETASLVRLTDPVQNGNIWTADVELKAALDRDRSPNTRDLWFKVSDGTNQMPGRVKLIILDDNDNPPFFVNLPYRISLEEGTSMVNKTVFTASAVDPDDGPDGAPTYSMAAQAQGADEQYNKTFVIRNANVGDITLAMELDYETRSFYQYQIFVKDRGTPQCPGPDCKCSAVTEPNVDCAGEPATFMVTVVDVQDSPPYFERLPYIAEVQENATAGTSFYQVSALDGDRGVPNDVSYSIVDESRYPFTIDPQTGILRVGAQGLDSDTPDGRNYFITVMASEVIQPGKQAGGDTNATTQVAITVHDINDNGPQFAQSVYDATVQENTPRGVPLTITTTIRVSDKDQNENGQFQLSVEKDGAPYDAFTTLPSAANVIQGTTTVMINVFNSSVLDFETVKNITFQLKATETSTTEKFSNTTTVILTIEDMNDNSPVFSPGQATEVNVTEHEQQGVVLAAFTATDDDTGNFGSVTYTLENGLGKFAMDPQSGNLSVQADIDREQIGGAGYSLVVIATDNMAGEEAQRRTSRLNIRVTVLDINDNAPVFQTHALSVTVQENASPRTVLTTLTASDADEGFNGKVIYKVVNLTSPTYLTGQPQQLFDVDENTGVVFVNNSLIGFPGSHNVTVMAVDSADDPKNASTMLSIYVQDVNINKPKFVVPDEDLLNLTANIIPNITVDEELPLGSQLLQMSATDQDTGNNGVVYYWLDPDLSGQFNYFAVDAIYGNLTNKRKLDREETAMFQINIKAEDQGTPTRLSTVIPFRVLLRDINDNDPEFLPPATDSLSVGEETFNVQVGYVATATDKDSDPANTKVCYYIYGGDLVDSFFLNKETRELRLLQKLDRDVTPSVDLLVKASADCSFPENHFTAGTNHSYDPADTSLLQVAVRVRDINDNPPVFDKDALTVGLLYDKEIGYEVINLVKFTRDGDTAEHSANMYKLLSYRVGDSSMPAEPTSPFTVSENGSVITNRLFRADEEGFFVLNVETYDKENQTDVADVKIYLVSDFQRVKLVFNKQPNQVEPLKGELVRKLEQALKMTIVVDKIATHITIDGKAEPQRTDVFIHARYKPSGLIVPTSELWNAFDYNRNVRKIFQELGVTETLPVVAQVTSADDTPLQKAFIIVAVVLGIICLVLIIVLFNTIRRYRRRLRAATTSAFVSKSDDTHSFVPPGTNRYYAAENPLYGKEVLAVDAQRLGSDSDSLDENAVDSKPGIGEKGREEEQEMYLELYDDDSGPGMHINHLAMVLQEYEKEAVHPPLPDDTSSPIPDDNHKPSADNDSSDDKHKSSQNGHVKADSGFNELSHVQPATGDINNLQYTDI